MTALGVIGTTEPTMPIPIVGFGEWTRRNGHGLGLDDDGYEVCTVCRADWPCPGALAPHPPHSAGRHHV